MQPHFFIVYDGIANSVFESQVVHPLVSQLERSQNLHITIVSFEHTNITPPTFHARLSVIIAHKIPYIGFPSRWYAAQQLKKILAPFSHYTLTARGPFAGAIAHIARTSHCSQFTIQARGLAAQEYRYVTRNTNHLLRPWHHVRAAQLEALETSIFGPGNDYIIESVSPALSEYLTKHYATEPSRITLAINDIPLAFSILDQKNMRTARRVELSIPDGARVYCYSGSTHAWQCPELVIAHFKKQYASNLNNYLLILSHDTHAFEKLIGHAEINPTAVRILSVSSDLVCSYLCAADVGFLFREPHPMNWVSRPTKALEYNAAGLTIEHNNTVAYLIEKGRL